jgi:hypothetical protein
MVAFNFGNVLGWFAFLSLLPLIILYLIKPKPKEISVPSLMFFHKDDHKKHHRAFFQRLSKDWLFWLQLLILAVLSFFFVQPSIILSDAFLLERTVLVVDASASTEMIFDELIDEAKGLVGKYTTLIIASGTPRVVLEDADKRTTLDFLNNMGVGATTSPLGEALLLAGEHVGADQSIFVISDFMETGDVSLKSTQTTLEGRGIGVHFIDVGEKRTYDNIGIIHLKPGEEESHVSIKNFQEESVDVDVLINDKKRTVTIGGGSVEIVPFVPIFGINKIILDVDDDFEADNEALVNIPSLSTLDVVLISDHPSPYVRAALSSSPLVDLDVVDDVPTKRYDVYVLHDIQRLSAQDVATLQQHIESGAGLVIHAQNDMKTIDYGTLLPVVLGEKQGHSAIDIAQDNKFTQNIHFGGVDSYFSVDEDKGVTLATASDSSLLSLMSLGEGKVAYYGILEDASDFVLDPGYPIFWTRLIHYLGNLRGLPELNKQGGSMMVFSRETTVRTPSGAVTTEVLYLDESGIYEIGGDKIAVNLVSEKESSLVTVSVEGKEESSLGEENGVEQSIEQLLLFLALGLLVLELLIIKVRGDV